jgi:hypothetical protein
MKDSKHEEPAFTGIQNGLQSLLNAQLQLGTEMLKMVSAPGGVLDKLSNLKLPELKLPRLKSCCDIPPPCWMPLSLGEICCRMPADDRGSVCLVVANGDFRAHTYEFAATGKSAAAVAFSTASVTLGPKERVAVTATFTMPAGDAEEDCRCIDHEVLIWVRGCRDHYLRWIVEEAMASSPCCAEVAVNDDPDYVLHWYDHFYTLRPCLGTAGAANPVRGARP